MEDLNNITSQWLGTSLNCHDPSKLFDLICDINRYERTHPTFQSFSSLMSSSSSSPSTAITSNIASLISTKNLARTVALGKLAVRQNKREQAIRTASAGLSFYNDTINNTTYQSLVTNMEKSTTTTVTATPLLWNIHGALLNEIMASWSNDDITFYQRAIQLLQVSIRTRLFGTYTYKNQFET